MKLEDLGELTRDPHIEEWMISPDIPIPYFNGMMLRFVLEDIEQDPFPEEFAAVIGNFLGMTAEHREQATPEVYENYLETREVCRMYDWAIPDIESRDIWSYVYPEEIFLSRGYDDKKVHLRITAGCEWEPEHGLQIVYREGRELDEVSEIR